MCVFRADDGECAVVVMSDFSLAAAAGGALAMLPATAIESAIREKTLSDELLANYREVLNVAGTLFNTPGARQLSLTDYLVAETLPRDVTRLFIRAPNKLHFSVEVENYPPGTLSVML
ncbi:MAG: hypothetical protein RJA70_1117 [Pseudomonadota bacterium]